MNNAAHQFANKVVAQYQFTNGSDSSLNHLIIGNSTAEIIDTLIYTLFSSHAETYDDGVVWFKSVDAINVEKSYITYNSRESCIFAYFVFDKNPLMLKTTTLHIDNVCYFGCESDTTNKTIEFLEKFKVRVSLAKECHKFKFNTEHHETLMHETIKTLKTIYEEHNDMDAEKLSQHHDTTHLVNTFLA